MWPITREIVEPIALAIIALSGVIDIVMRVPRKKASASNAKNITRQRPKSLTRRRWIILLIELMLIAYVLFEVLRPGELTKLSVYKIVLGTCAFFFILIQSAISNAFDAIARMKMADLDLLESIGEKERNR